ncbi:MAG: hypothetical protein ACTS45_00390 [Candidatus Hodgkinia cicadicola]
MEDLRANSLGTKLTSEGPQTNVNYYPIGNINRLGNYLRDYLLVVKRHGCREVLSKVKSDLQNQITLTAFAFGLPEAQANAIIKSVNDEAKALFIVTVQEIANMFLVVIRAILNTLERYQKPLSLIKAKTGWAPPYNLLKQTAVTIQKDFIQNQNPFVTMLYNASRIVSFWMQYFRASTELESIWFSIYKLLSGSLTSKLYTSLIPLR